MGRRNLLEIPGRFRCEHARRRVGLAFGALFVRDSSEPAEKGRAAENLFVNEAWNLVSGPANPPLRAFEGECRLLRYEFSESRSFL